MRYYVTLAGRTVEVELTDGRALVDGQEVDVELASVPGSTLRHLRVNGVGHTLDVRRGETRGEWEVGVGGRSFATSIVDERTRAIRELAGTHATRTERTVTAPMPGLVVRVEVEEGQAVRAGQGVVIVEAMKMENELRAPGDGVVARVEVTAGQTVEKGAVLIVLE
ncbi:MAG TPA: biotin/lipoyl-containing protein [Longimicrobiaceae bacterium]